MTLEQTVREIVLQTLRESGFHAQPLPTPAQLRIRAGYTRQELAAASVISISTITRLENGQITRTTGDKVSATIRAIASTLQLDPTEYTQAIERQISK